LAKLLKITTSIQERLNLNPTTDFLQILQRQDIDQELISVVLELDTLFGVTLNQIPEVIKYFLSFK
jgi:hypothetical protein